MSKDQQEVVELEEKLKQQHEDDITLLTAQHAEQLEKQAQKHANDVTRLKQECAAQIAKLKNAHAEYVRRRTDAYFNGFEGDRGTIQRLQDPT